MDACTENPRTLAGLDNSGYIRDMALLLQVSLSYGASLLYIHNNGYNRFLSMEKKHESQPA